MATLKIREPAGSDTWVEIADTGGRGPAGGTVPTGGDPGQVIVKTGPADLEVGWATRPRVALNVMIGNINSHATAGTFSTIVSGDVDIDPARTYHIHAGLRCIADPGAVMCSAEAHMDLGTVGLEGNDVWATADTGLWGAWNQSWLYPGTHFTATPATLTCTLTMKLTAAASKAIYSPRIYVIEY